MEIFSVSKHTKPNNLSIMIDLHMHTVLSDGKDNHESHIKMALQKGIDIMGFTDHICLKPVSWAIREEDLAVMTEKIQNLKDQDWGPLEIRFGIEMDYFLIKKKKLLGLLVNYH